MTEKSLKNDNPPLLLTYVPASLLNIDKSLSLFRTAVWLMSTTDDSATLRLFRRYASALVGNSNTPGYEEKINRKMMAESRINYAKTTIAKAIEKMREALKLSPKKEEYQEYLSYLVAMEF